MEFFVEEIRHGKIMFVLSILERQGCQIFITAKDAENRRIWKTPLLDESGTIITYQDVNAAMNDAKQKIPSIAIPTH